MRPDRPYVGVGGVVLLEGRVLLIRRGKEPLRGRWVIPGGTVELGETLQAGASCGRCRRRRGSSSRPREVVARLRPHPARRRARSTTTTSSIDYLCDYVSGEPRAGSDADEVALVARDDIGAYDVPPQARDLVLDVFSRQV